MRVRHFAVVLFAFILATAAATTTGRASVESQRSVMKSLHWGTGTMHLAQSNATFTVPSAGRMVVGADAIRADNAINGDTDTSTEGFLESKSGDSLYLSYDDSGYVKDDFQSVDADAMMADIKKSTEDANDQRRQNGISPLHIDGWEARPTYSKATNTAHFAIAAHTDSGDHVLNVVALKLGRHGYERFTLVTDSDHAPSSAAELGALTNDYAFARGSRFADHVDGDRLAEFGLAALVGTAAGATIAKTIGFGAILLIVKKFFVLIVAGFVALFTRVRKYFSRDRTPMPALPKSSPFETPAPPENL